MKKKVIIFSSVGILLAAIFVTVGFQNNWFQAESQSHDTNIFYNSTSNSVSSQETSEIPSEPSSSTAKPVDPYFAKEYNGHIGFFRNGEAVPFQELDTSVNALPEQDQLQLKQGIPIKNEKELQSIIEDYGS